MTAAADRAQAYLRLMAEAELRRALAYPRCEQPEPSGIPRAARSAVRLSGPVLAPLIPPVLSMVPVSGSLLASLWPAVRSAASAARQTPAGRAAEPVLWRALRARRAVRPLLAGRSRFAEPPAEAALDRVREVASALVQAGAIGETAAEAVLGSLTDALALRGKTTSARLLYRPLISGAQGPAYPWPPASHPPSLPAGVVQSVPIGTTLPLGPGGQMGTAGLLALVLASDRAVITATAHLSQPDAYSHRPRPWPPSPLPFGGLTAIDEHGTQYQAQHTAQPACGRWSLAFDLAPVPPPGTRWLDITGPAIGDPIRVGLNHAAPPGSAPDLDPAGDPAQAGLTLPGRAGLPAGLIPAERPLDALAERLLAGAVRGYRPGQARLSGLAEVAGALQEAAGLAAGSPALSRLAALADRLGPGFPAGLRPLTQPVDLPEAWASVLDHRGAADGPDRVAAVGAVLPEVDGARFALAGLDSVAGAATLRVLAWGWQPSPGHALGGERFSWWARDDQGRWHLALEHGEHYGGGQADLLIEFGPALHPDARSLELRVRGPASQAAVTVPLRWMASR